MLKTSGDKLRKVATNAMQTPKAESSHVTPKQPITNNQVKTFSAEQREELTKKHFLLNRTLSTGLQFAALIKQHRAYESGEFGLGKMGMPTSIEIN